MLGFWHGYQRAVSEVIGGVITAVILNAFISSGLLDPSFVLYFKLLNMLGLMALVLVMPYWGTIYLIGWLFGLIIMAESGLVGILDFIIYFGIPLVILIVRVCKKVDEFTYSVL